MRASLPSLKMNTASPPPYTIINVSPISPDCQELHILESRWPDLIKAVAKTNGLLKVGFMDASAPGYETSDEDAIAKAKDRFRKRLDGDIARLSDAKSRRLRDLAAFLVIYKNEGMLKSEPRGKPEMSEYLKAAFGLE